MAGIAATVKPIRTNWRRILLAVVVVALTVTLTIQLAALRDDHSDSESRKDAIAVAERVAVGLTSFRTTEQTDALQTVTKDLTGDLAKQVSSEQKLLEAVLKDAAATSSSSVDLAGVENCDRKVCRVLVALTARVKNRDAPRGETRRYRMRIELTATGGRWQASSLEMVP